MCVFVLWNLKPSSKYYLMRDNKVIFYSDNFGLSSAANNRNHTNKGLKCNNLSPICPTKSLQISILRKAQTFNYVNRYGNLHQFSTDNVIT